MFGCEIIFATDNGPVTAVGCIFNDGSIYVHEPRCDMWASIPDMLEEVKPEGFRVVGPVVPVEDVKAHMWATHKSAHNALAEQAIHVKREYDDGLARLGIFDQYNTPLSFRRKTDEPEKVA